MRGLARWARGRPGWTCTAAQECAVARPGYFCDQREIQAVGVTLSAHARSRPRVRRRRGGRLSPAPGVAHRDRLAPPPARRPSTLGCQAAPSAVRPNRPGRTRRCHPNVEERPADRQLATSRASAGRVPLAHPEGRRVACSSSCTIPRRRRPSSIASRGPSSESRSRGSATLRTSTAPRCPRRHSWSALASARCAPWRGTARSAARRTWRESHAWRSRRRGARRDG